MRRRDRPDVPRVFTRTSNSNLVFVYVYHLPVAQCGAGGSPAAPGRSEDAALRATDRQDVYTAGCHMAAEARGSDYRERRREF